MVEAVRRDGDPIVAIATASGRGAVGIVRVSGRGLARFVERLCGRGLEPRRATYLPFADAAGAPIDRGLALWFPAPHSFTGEDVLELQSHGGPVVLRLLLERCLAVAASAAADGAAACLPGLRLAAPGEFTERAFLNDKLDLAQAEAVADLIDAATASAARSAARSLDGEFSRRVGALAEALVELRALVEATLDFPDEEVDFLDAADARGRLEAARAGVDAVLAQARRGALLRDGLHVVLAGAPNVGKSSLLNALAGAELAIVTATPGTTRDRIGQQIAIDGVPLHIVDTAGLREATDEVERIGVARSWAEIERADAIVFVHDLTRLDDAAYAAEERAIEARLAGAGTGRLLHVLNKADALDATGRAGRESAFDARGTRDRPPRDGQRSRVDALTISARTGEGLDRLRAELLRRAGWEGAAEGTFIARARHVDALGRCRDHLARAAQQAAHGNAHLELVAEELRLGHDALGEITGAFGSDELLGAIFGRFCIGK